MTEDQKQVLHRYLIRERDALVHKLDGLGEYDLRRPMTATGTNLLGLVKHVASVQADYFGPVFDRPHGIALPWLTDGAEVNADMWVPPEQSTADVIALWDASNAHTDATIGALPLDAVGVVPWWSEERRQVTLGQVLVHQIAETSRHAGHADIVRECIDARAGDGDGNLPEQSVDAWARYVARLESAARAAGGV